MKPWERYAHQKVQTPELTTELPDTVPEWESIGLCVNCGQPVTRINGLRNWFGQPVHLCCPDKMH